MPNAIYERIALGDFRPITVQVVPTDAAVLTSATYRVVRRRDPKGFVWLPEAPCVVTALTVGYQLATPLILFNAVDTYTVKFSLTWDDTQVDNSVRAVVIVRSRSDNEYT